MRHIEKGCEPEYLTEHKDKWLEAFLASGKPRPDSNKYAHPKIKDVLWSASYGKCFYCECSLCGSSKEVDHFIEVAERKDLAFDWNNLNLSCDLCNNKRPNKDIPVDKVLDPCKDSDEEIQNCITFNGEYIREVNNSDKGRQTIKKYQLDSELQNHRRLKHLGKLMKEIISLLNCKSTMTEEDKEKLRSWTYPTAPYSYMVEVYLKDALPQIFK